MNKFRRAAGAIAVLGSMIMDSAVAYAQPEPFGPPIGGWNFTQEAVKGDWRVRCRATRVSGGTTYRIDVYANWKWYFSVTPKPAQLDGKYPSAQLNLTDGPLPSPAFTSGNMLVFGPIEDLSMDAIAQQGGALRSSGRLRLR
ncbi:hypothetical protein [Aquibium oceanicum]|uniref:Uncharacterized protein n=1 Tax=Aquibium oceanicum TaxID=1670800 RepID=A0A1L3SNC1_9HYPH|nr:hypothetical protein [Aquibium oceanicum]APH70898.1 hypothetical protein BSQ44_05530 [Aquibium oceanicum]